MDIPKLRLTRTRLAGAALGVTALVAIVALLAPPISPDDRGPFADSRPPPGLAERFYPPDNWAWGLIRVRGAPAQRYGVAAPSEVALADVLILPDYGETAETWFETARDLTADAYAVWVLEGVGQGGSGRLASRRDLGHLQSFDADVTAVRAMAEQVIHSEPRRPLVILGEGVGAFVAARAVETGERPAALILSAPDCVMAPAPPSAGTSESGEARAPGGGPWRRDGPDDFSARRTHDAWRGAVTHAWQLANPDLRLGGPSLDWRKAFLALRRATGADVGGIRVPTLVLEAAGAPPCLDPPGARLQDLAGARPSLELEDDARRAPWLDTVRKVVADARASAPSATALFKPTARR